jgi:hypothetical protein
MTPKIFYRKLYEQHMIDRWLAGSFTSFHHHGEIPEWAARKANGKKKSSDFPLRVWNGRGISLPSAREFYVARCITQNADWNTLNNEDKWATEEQAGVFACATPAGAYWYGGEPEDGDRFVAFYGVKLCDGPDLGSVLTPVIKLLTVAPVIPDEFVNQFCGGVAPPQPVGNLAAGELQIQHVVYDGGNLVGDGGEDDYGPMPDLTKMK